MKQSKWIWYPGDFELYHSMLLHNRRTYQGVYYPPMWRIDAPTRNVMLYKKAEIEQPETLTVYANTKQASFLVNGTRYPVGTTVTLEPGKYFIKLFDKRNYLAHIQRPVVKSDTDGKNFTYAYLLFAVNHLYNRLFLHGAEADYTYLRRNNFKQGNAARKTSVKRTEV